VAIVLVALTLAVGSAAAFALVPGCEPGAPMLAAAALATTLGMLAGLVGAVVYLWRRFAALPPLLSVLRVFAAASVATAVARAIPGQGKMAGLAATVAAGIVFAVMLFLLREFGKADREKFAKILKLGGRR
jgi:hypothetical protein